MTHYYSPKQTSPTSETEITIRLKNLEFHLFSGSGVFSKKRLDTGTRVLIENCEIPENASILDLGCGIGVVGISVKMRYPKTKVTQTDVNERAIMLTKKNLKKHNLDNKVKVSDGFTRLKDEYDVILFNPPQSAGKKVCFKLIEESYKHLHPEGSLQLIARRNKGGNSLSKKMEEVFGNVEVIVKRSGYWLYMSFKS